MARRQYCTFYLDELYFGVEVLQVQEVLRYQAMTCVPLASNVVRGLNNLRGQIVTAIDLRRRLGLPERKHLSPEGEDPFMNVILHTRDAPVSLLVDKIGDVIEVDEQDFDPPPHHLGHRFRAQLKGVCKLEQGLLLVLDTESTVEFEALASPVQN